MIAPTATVQEFLRKSHVPYSLFPHQLAYTAQKEAAASHVPTQDWAKVVVCFADDEPIQAVVPATLAVNLNRLRDLAGARNLRLAREDELSGLYPDCETGAMPPLGPLYQQRVFVDDTLTGEPEIFFDAGTHTDAIRMRYADFASVAKPIVGAFGRNAPR